MLDAPAKPNARLRRTMMRGRPFERHRGTLHGPAQAVPLVRPGDRQVAQDGRRDRVGHVQSISTGCRIGRDGAGRAHSIGIRGLLVHAIADEAKAFYLRLGLSASPIEPMTLMVTIADLRAAMA